MTGRVVAVHPRPGGGAPGWTAKDIGAPALVASGAAGAGVPAPAEGSAVRMSAGVALILARSVSTAGLTAAAFLGAVGSVLGAVEVVGPDGSTAAVVTGGRRRAVDDLDLALTGLVLEVDGTQVATAAGAAAGGHPALAAAEGLSSIEDTLAEGTTVFAGRWTAPVPVSSGGYLQASFGHLGGISVRVP